MNLDQWAARWHLPAEALAELAAVQWEAAAPDPGGSEAWVLSNTRLKAATLGDYLWRNNVGAAEMARGGYVRFGLANDSPKLNAVLKSADLVGWRPHVVVPEDVGRTLAVFLSVECKAKGWRPTSDPRYAAQMRWYSLVKRCGGYAYIVQDADELVR